MIDIRLDPLYALFWLVVTFSPTLAVIIGLIVIDRRSLKPLGSTAISLGSLLAVAALSYRLVLPRLGSGIVGYLVVPPLLSIVAAMLVRPADSLRFLERLAEIGASFRLPRGGPPRE